MTTPTADTAGSARALRIRQAIVVSLLFGGYASLYLCRADLSVAAPLLAKELVGHGLSYNAALVRIGAITSLGILAYAIGKPFIGGLGDYWGGRINFLIGLAGATLCTLLFAFSGVLPLFTTAWFLNRLSQAGAWAGLLKVSSRWFDYSSHGAIIGVLSLSYLIGDAGAREWMGRLIAHGYGWRSLFMLAALLHDIGNLIATVPDDIADWRVDARHEATGARWLGEWFGPDVAEPVRLHVRAKRYLCTVDPEYFSQLSPASVLTLKLQGGPLPADEVASFEAEHGYREAIVVRRCDDRGKVAGLATRRLEDYRDLLRSLTTGSR